MIRQSGLTAAGLNFVEIHNKVAEMNPQSSHPLRLCLLVTAMFIETMVFSAAALAQLEGAQLDFQKPGTVLPLEQSASRGITTRDPSSIIKCKDEYWVFYTGRGVPSYH
jgi:hypothetical protein